MKRIISILLILLCLTMVFASCGNKKHKPKVVEVVAPTCTDMGYTEYTCKHCESNYVDDFTNALGHAYSDAVALVVEDCTNRGVYESTCVRCGELHRYSVNAKGHSYVEISADGETVAYECEACRDVVTLANDERIEDYVGCVEIFDVEPTFTFKVTSSEGEEHIRNNLKIIDAYFNGSEYESAPDVAKEYVLSNDSGNVWTVSVSGEYEYDTTYLVKLTGGVKLADYKGNELSFTVVDDPNHENAYEYSDSAVFLKALENANGGYYPYQISADGGYLYLTVGKIDGISKGQLLCIGEVSSIYDINSDTECYFGVVEATYPLADGRYMVKLAEPAIETIFNQFDIAYNEDVNLDGVEVNIEQLKADLVNSLYANEDFVEFLSAVHISSNSYLKAKDCYSPELMDTNAFLNSISLRPTVNFSGNSLYTTIAGDITLSIKNSSGNDVGTLTIDFTFEIESQFKIDVKYEINTSWKGIKIERFDVAMTQTDNIGFEFGITVDADTLVNDAQYVMNLATGEAHLACCIEVTRADEDTEFKTISATEAQSANKKCTHCRPEGGEDLADDFKGYYIETLYCSDWERVCADINKLLEANGSDIGTTIKLGGVKIPVFGPVSVNLDLGFAISFDVRAIMNYSCSFAQTSVYGMRLNHSYVQPYSQISGGSVTENELEILGFAEVKAGLAVEAYVNISGLEKWIKAGVRAELGAYSDISGMLDSVSDISGAYLETGVYLDISAFYKLVKNEGDADVAEVKKPLQKYGYEKLYFGYETYYDAIEILGSFDIAANDILNVKYYDLVNMVIKTDELSLNERGKYTVTLSLASGEYCEIKNGVIVYKLGAPKVFSDTLIITVKANNGEFGKYRRGSALYYLDTVEIDFTFDTNHTHIWQEATCTTAKTCTVCGLKEGEALGHNFSEATCTTPKTCLVCGETEGLPIHHIESDWIIDKEATKTEYGSKHKECTVCGYVITTVSINPTGSQGLSFAVYSWGCVVTGIGTCTDTNIVIPATYNGLPVKEIYEKAFYNCIALTSITIPDSVTSIGNYAFGYCSSLESVTMGNSVMYISDSSFSHCTSLTSITIPDSVTKIGSAFSGCTSLTSVTFGENSQLTSIIGRAFSDCFSLTTISIPNSVTSIGNNAFERCTSLTYIEIPNSVTSISGGAFQNCEALTSIEIPDSVTSIEMGTFYGCTSLISITIPDSVTRIDQNAFYNCTSLTDVYYIGEVDSWIGIIFNDPIMNYAKNLYFNGELVTSVIIPDSVTSIGNNAFSGYSLLTSITIGNSVTSIGSYAFSGCSSLTSIEIPDSVTSIGSYAFSGCDSLKSVIMGKSVRSIGARAFFNCTLLTSITIPKSTTSIGEFAFLNCISLIEVCNKSSLNIVVGSEDCGRIGYYAKHIINDESKSAIRYVGDYVFFDDGANVYLVKYFGNEATITLPKYDSGKEYAIWKNAFKNYKITSVTIPAYVTSIGDYAFSNCTLLTSIDIPNSVTSIGKEAFSNCTSLTSLTIGNSVMSIGESAFSNCTSLTSVNIPDSVTSIGVNAFGSCSALISIIIPDSVTSIGSMSFIFCSSLTSIVIPDSVTSVGSWAFGYCDKLTIYCEASSQPSGWNAEWNKYYNRTIVWGYKPE